MFFVIVPPIFTRTSGNASGSRLLFFSACALIVCEGVAVVLQHCSGRCGHTYSGLEEES